MATYPGFYRGSILCALIVIFQLLFLYSAQAQKPEHVHSGLLRIKVSEGMARQLEKSSLKKNANNVVATGIETFDRVNRKFKVSSMKRVFPHAGKFEAKHRKYGLHRWYEVEIEKSTPIHQAIPGFKSITDLEVVEPVYKKQIVGSPNPGFGPIVVTPSTNGTLPNNSNDPMLGSQWHYNNTGQTGGTIGSDINLFEAWNVETGSPNVIVAVEDGGIDLTHPDLAANLWVNDDEIPNNGLDDDANGYVDDYNGYSFVDHTGNILAHDHGTHVAGTVAAVNNNGVGVAGVAGGSGNGDGVRLMSCAVFSYWGGADGFAQAFIYSADNGAVISQNSWSYTFPDYVEQAILDGIDYFIAEAGKDEFGSETGPMNGGIVIFAAANSNSNANYWPAVYEPVLSVAATNHMDMKSWYSNYGSWVDIAAPGGETDVYEQGVLSTLPSSQYGYYQGTSMACPHVSGVAGLVVSQMAGSGFTPALLRERLVQTTDNIDDANPSFVGQLGSGRLNAANALVNEDDGIPPASISDLVVTSSSLHSIILSWTAPADGSRAASAYDLRISNQPITEANFYSAEMVTGLTGPKAPGATETFAVPNLNAGMLYYFAINSRDYHGNTSLISNLAEASTLPPPVIDVAPMELSADLVTAGSDTLMFTITNSGLSTLNYWVIDNDSLGRVTVDVQAGELSPSNSANIYVPVNASGLLAGQYPYEIRIASNDPVTPLVVLPLILNVTNNGVPIASISTNNLSFGKVMLSRSKTLGVLVKNEGSEPLEVESAGADHPSFQSGAENSFSIAAFESRIINVTFSPTDTGTVAATFTINTNDPLNQQLLVQLAAQGVEAPSLVVTPTEMTFNAHKGHVKDVYLSMTNIGGSNLSWRLQEHRTSDSANFFATEHILSKPSVPSAASGALQSSSGVFRNVTTLKIEASALSQKPSRVLIVSPDPDVNDLVSVLSAYPDLMVGSISPQWIDAWTFLPYDVVIVSNNFPWTHNGGDPEKIGNLLADYVDAGGKVIVNQLSYMPFPDYQLQGRFVSENYAPFSIGTSFTYDFANLGEIPEPAHPVLNSVSFLQYYGYTSNVGLTPGSSALAKWDNGSILIAANEHSVGLNILPSNGYGSYFDWTGDLPLILHNAIVHLASPQQTYLTLDIPGGIIEPQTTIGYVRVRMKSEGLEPGSYQTELKLSSNDPNNRVVTIPVSITILGEQFTASPDSIVATLYRGESRSQAISIDHNGTTSHAYDVTVEPNGVQSVMALMRAQGFDDSKNAAPAINPETYRDFARKASSSQEVKFSEAEIKAISLPPMPAVLNTAYATDFEDFALGDAAQNGWSIYNGWTIDSTNAYSGTKHLHQEAREGVDFTLALSPFVANGPSTFSSVSMKLYLQGSVGTFEIVPLPSNGEQSTTSVIFDQWGIAVYEKVGEWSQRSPLNAVRPSGYFDLTIETNEITGIFSIYFDDQEVFHGQGFKGDISNVLFLTSTSEGSDISIDIDDIRLYDGKKFNELPRFIAISPSSGNISPEETLNIDVLLKTDSIAAGTYLADINFFADQDAIAIPVVMNYIGSQLTLAPSTLSVDMLADQTTTTNFTITNGGAGEVPVTITAVSTGVYSGPQNTIAAPVELMNRHYEALRTKRSPGATMVLPGLTRDSSFITPAATLYGTGFEEFTRGSLQQLNWGSNEFGFVDSANASQGAQHARLVGQATAWAQAFSPAIAPGSATKSSVSVDIDLNGTVYSSNITLQSLGRLVTDISFSNNSLYVLNYLGGETYESVQVYEDIPSSFFNIAIEVDKATSQFTLLMDGRVIYTGQAGDNYISLAYFGLGGESDATVDIDNFRIQDGALSAYPEFLSFSPDSGVVPPGGSLDIVVNITAPPNAGQYSANIIVQDGAEQKILPMILTVTKPELRVSPEYLYQEQAVGQINSQYLYLENIGTSYINYDIKVKPHGIYAALAQMDRNRKAPGKLAVLPSSQRPFAEVARQLLSNPNLKIEPSIFGIGKIESTPDSTATLYATSFEEFEFGSAAQFGWSTSGKPAVVSDASPFTGQKHLSLSMEPGGENYGNVISPYVATGISNYVSSSTKVNLQGDLSFWTIAHSPYGATSAILYYLNGSVYVYSSQGFQATSIQLPQGYFDLTFQINRQSSKLGIYLNDELVFSGYAAANDIAMMEYVVSNDYNVNGAVDIDDVQIIDGQGYPSPYLIVSPPSGTLYPYQSTYIYATFDSEGLSRGTYLADIEFKVAGSTIQTVPVTLNVVGLPEIQVTPGSHHVVLDYHGQDEHDLLISNPGGQTLYFNLGIEEQEGIAGAISPIAKTSRDDAKTIQKLEEDKNLSTKTASAGIQPVTIVVGKTVSGEQFESGVPPSQWSVVNNTATGPQWSTASSFGEGNYSYSGEAATVSSDAFGSAPLNTELISPQYDVRGYQAITLQYYANYQNYGNRDFLDLDIRINGEGEWKTILKWNEDHGGFRSWGEFVSINLDYVLMGATSFQLRWHYYDSNPGAHDWYAQIDNVSIIANSLPWLTLNQSWGWVEPGSALSVGMFMNGTMMPEGTFAKLIRVSSNAVNAPLLDVPVSMTIRSAPNLVFEPDTITHRLYVNTSTQRQAMLSNTGESKLTYSFLGSQAPAVATNNVSRIYPQKFVVDKMAKDTRVGHPVVTGQGGPDQGGYSWVDSHVAGGPVFSWDDIRYTGNYLNLGDDDAQLVDLPFAFPFYDKVYTQLRVGSNGYVTFGEVGNSLANSELPDSNEPNNLIAALWDDLYPAAGGGVSYQSFADRFIIQYTDVPYFYSNTPNTFQIILNRDGDIVLQYLNINNLFSSTTGIENSDGSTGLQVAFNTNYITSNHAILFSNKGSKWLRVNPSAGEIEGNSATTVTLDFKADGLEAGTHMTNLVISSNDTDEPMKQVPVELTVFDNYAPVVDSIQSMSVVETQTSALTITAHDEDDSYVSLLIINKPAFVTLTSSGNGTAAYSIKPLLNDRGTYRMTVEATDSRGLKSYRDFQLQVVPYGVQNFSLIDKRNGQVILNFAGSVTLNKANAAFPYYQIRANTNPATVGSVQFFLNGKSTKGSASAPYLMADGELKNLKVGNHMIKATAYTQKLNKGQVGASAEAVITIINQASTSATAATASLSVSPNPVERELRVVVTGVGSEQSELVIVDGTGYTVYRTTVTSAQMQDLRLDLSTLRSGIYYLQIADSQGQRVTTRLIKK